MSEVKPCARCGLREHAEWCPFAPGPAKVAPEAILAPTVADLVNDPPHYRLKSGVECLDVIEELKLNFRLGNALKYLWRAGRKDPAKVIEDLRKCVFYLNREIAALERK